MNDKLLIFDFDGTLADTIKVSRKVFNKIRHKYHLPEAKNDDFIRELQNINVFDALRKLGLGEEVIEDFLLFIKNEYSTEDIKPFPGIVDVIKKIHSNGVKLAIVSSNHTGSIESFLKEHFLTDIFQYILGADINTNKAENIKYILEKTNSSTENTYFIGDTISDINEAKEANIKTVGVTWGFHNEEKLKEVSPDMIVREVKDLFTI